MDWNKLDKIAERILMGAIILFAGTIFIMAEIIMWKDNWIVCLIVHLIMIPVGYLFFRGKLFN